MTEQQLAELMYAPLGDERPATINIDELAMIVRVDILADIMAEPAGPIYRRNPNRPRSGPVETGL